MFDRNEKKMIENTLYVSFPKNAISLTEDLQIVFKIQW
jgi:hypothetical protein